MALLAINDIYRVNIYCLHQDQVSKNVLYYKLDSVFAGGADSDLAEGISLLLHTEMKALFTVDAGYRGIGVQRQLPAPTTMEAFNTFHQGVGTVAGPALPKQCCGLITKRTAFAGRRFRGRFYAPFPGEADNDGINARPTAGYVTRLDNLASKIVGFWALVPAGGGITGRFGLFNKTSGAFEPTLTKVARDRWATQRRRGDFGAQNVSPI